MRKKVKSPGHRRKMAGMALEAGLCSGRAACRIFQLSRGTYWYEPKTIKAPDALIQRMKELSEKHDRYGYRKIAALLREEGWRVGKRLIRRLRRAEGFRVPPSRRKQPRRGLSTESPTRANHRGHVWTWDFISDATVRVVDGKVQQVNYVDLVTFEIEP